MMKLLMEMVKYSSTVTRKNMEVELRTNLLSNSNLFLCLKKCSITLKLLNVHPSWVSFLKSIGNGSTSRHQHFAIGRCKIVTLYINRALLFHENRAWVTIDNRLYLWNYMLPQDCEVYDGLTDIILSVSLSAPKPGMFLDNIKYLLILGEIAL